MRQFFKFWWLCVRTAFRGNTAFANDWQWLFGVPVCSGLAVFVARQQGISELSTGNVITDAVLAALGAFVVTWLVAFAVRVLNAPMILYNEEKRKADLVADRIEVLFPERCNSPGVESAFKRSWSPLCSEGGSARRVSFHSFFVAIQNPSNNKTLRNVRLVMETLSLGPGQVLNMSCVCERTETDRADIPPGGEDFFLIGEGVDEDDAGMFRPRFIAKAEYDVLMNKVDSDEHSRFKIRSGTRSLPLLRNEGYRVEITAYADDMPPARKVLIIDAKNRTAMHLNDRAN
jgi:hypothetical protein